MKNIENSRLPKEYIEHADTSNLGKNKLLKLREVEDLTSLKKSTIYGMIQAGSFPPPVKVTGSRSAWPDCEVQEWISKLIASRDGVNSNMNGRVAR